MFLQIVGFTFFSSAIMRSFSPSAATGGNVYMLVITISIITSSVGYSFHICLAKSYYTTIMVKLVKLTTDSQPVEAKIDAATVGNKTAINQVMMMSLNIRGIMKIPCRKEKQTYQRCSGYMLP